MGILLTLTLTIMIEFLNTVLVKYEGRSLAELRLSKKTVQVTKIKQTLVNLVNNFFALLVILLLCHNSQVLLVWAGLGKGIGFCVFHWPEKTDDVENTSQSGDESDSVQ